MWSEGVGKVAQLTPINLSSAKHNPILSLWLVLLSSEHRLYRKQEWQKCGENNLESTSNCARCHIFALWPVTLETTRLCGVCLISVEVSDLLLNIVNAAVNPCSPRQTDGEWLYHTSSLDLSLWLHFPCSLWLTAKPDLSLGRWVVWVNCSTAEYPTRHILMKGITSHTLQSTTNEVEDWTRIKISLFRKKMDFKAALIRDIQTFLTSFLLCVLPTGLILQLTWYTSCSQFNKTLRSWKAVPYWPSSLAVE